VVFGNTRKINDVNYDLNYTIADEIASLFPSTLSNTVLSALDLQGVYITVNSVNHDKQSVFDEEMPDEEYKIRGESLLFSVDYTIQVKSRGGCKSLSCPDGAILLNDAFLSVIFGVGSLDNFSINVDTEDATYLTEELTNISTIVYNIGGNIVTLPFTLKPGNDFNLVITRTDAAKTSIVKITGNY